jgi:hypothetical protein
MQFKIKLYFEVIFVDKKLRYIYYYAFMEVLPAIKKPPTLQREHLALQNMKVLQFFCGSLLLAWIHIPIPIRGIQRLN